MRRVILFIFPINIYLGLSIQPSFFLSSILGGAGGGGSMTGQILGQAVPVTGAPSDVFDNYSSSPNGLLTQRS